MTLASDRKTSLRALSALALATLAFWWLTLRMMALESGTVEQTFVISVTVCAALWLAVATGRLAFGVFLATLTMGLVWLASSLKVKFLHEPLLAPDLAYFSGTLTRDVIGHYPGMLRKALIAILGGGVLCVLLWRLESPGRWQGRRRRVRMLATMLALLPLALCLWPHGPFRQVFATPTWTSISEGARNPISSFFRSFATMQIVLPARAATIDAAQWREPDAHATTQAPTRPDIIAVLEESTLDPRQWAACTSPRCSFAMFEPDAHTRAYGSLRVHTYGGGTWTSEFAFFAGLPHALFGAAGIYAPYNLAPRLTRSLPRHLRALGYRTVAVYPMAADFVGAALAYRDYGFEEFHDSAELGLKWESTDSELFEGFEAIHARLRASDERPLFVMMLTMRQHGPHDYPLDTLPAPWNQPPAPRLDARMNRNLATYLYRMQQSDRAIARLREYLFADGRPTVLVHFGDHHPSFDGTEQSLASALPGQSASDARVDTYYRIDANFAARAPATPAVLDLAFLGSLVLDVAGLPKGEYFQANALLGERCHGLFEGCPAPILDSYFGYIFDDLGVLE